MSGCELVAGRDLENQFRGAVERLHDSPRRKLRLIGPRRYLTRECAGFFGSATEREAELFFGGAIDSRATRDDFPAALRVRPLR
jgi:hypothetical protein